MTAPEWGLLSLCDTSRAGATDRGHSGPDVVLVHGLGGGRVTTWEAEDGTIWPRDLLPERIADIRVFTYGYPGTLKSLADSPNRRKLALELLQLLAAERRQFPALGRPIIWVGHGLGGSIIKKVIMDARYDSAFMEIFHLTFGVVFFSTPHHGLDQELFYRMLMACKPPWVTLLDEPPADLLDGLGDRLGSLGRESERFQTIRNIKFINLLEGSGSPRLDDVVVPHEQAIFGSLPDDVELIQHVHPDYHLMCKFPARGAGVGGLASYFDSVAENIEQAVTTSRRLPGLNRRGIASLEWLGVSKIRPIPICVEPTDGTCNWITQTEEYKLWNRPRIPSRNISKLWISKLWIVGPMGCGKTHLAKHIWVDQDCQLESTNSHAEFKANATATAHCSVDNIIYGRRTFDSILPRWAFDILMAQPWLIHPCLLARYDTIRAEKPGSACDQSEAFIKDLFRDVMVNVAKDTDCLVLIADGIDKLEHPALAMRNLLDCINEVAEFSQSHQYPTKFKLLMLSTHTPDLDMVARKESDILVHSISASSTSRDMRITLKPHVDTILRSHGEGEDGPLGNLVWDRIERSAHKISYSWSTILVSELKTVRPGSGDPGSLLREIPPRDLTELYREILGHRILEGGEDESSIAGFKSAPTTTTFAQNLLLWVTHQLGVMTREELRIACTLSVKCGYPDGFRRERPSSDLILRQLEGQPELLTVDDHDMFDEALEICTPLLRTASCSPPSDEQRFTVAHDSLREFIVTTPLGTSHDIAAMVCMNYLLLLPVGSSTDLGARPRATGSAVAWQAEALDLVSSYPFASYAATRWLDHFTLALSSSSSPGSLTPRKRRNLDLLLGPGSEFVRPWTLVFWYHTRGREGEPYPIAATPGGGSHAFPWAAMFSEKEVKVIERALRLASAALSEAALEEGVNAVNGGTQEGTGPGEEAGEPKSVRIGPRLNPRTHIGPGRNLPWKALPGRRGRVIILTVIIVLLVIIGAAVGGSQVNKSR